MWGGDVDSDGGDAVDVQCGFYGIPGLLAADGRVFAALVDVAKSSPRLILTEPMKAAIDFKWQAYGRRTWLWQMATWLTLVVSWIVGLYLLLVPASPASAEDEGWTGSENSTRSTWLATTVIAPLLPSAAPAIVTVSDGALVFSLVPLLTLKLALEEVLECRGVGVVNYLRSPNSWIDMTLVAVVWTLSWLLAQDSTEPAVHLGAVGTFVVLLKGGQVMRGSPRMAFLVTMLMEVLVDMVPFLLMQMAVVLAYSFAFTLLHAHDDASNAFDTSWLSFFTSYNLLVLAAGTDKTDLYHNTSPTVAVLYYTSTVIVPVVMLNALIAIMGDTFDRVSETRQERGLLQRAKMLIEMERAMLFKRPEHFGRWLHAVRRKDAPDGTTEDWAGRLRVMRADVKDLKMSVAANQQDLKMSVAANQQELKQELKASQQASHQELKAKIDEVLARLALVPSVAHAADDDSALAA